MSSGRKLLLPDIQLYNLKIDSWKICKAIVVVIIIKEVVLAAVIEFHKLYKNSIDTFSSRYL